MAGRDLTAEVRQFVLDHIDSIEQLEVLLTVSKELRTWTVAQVQEEIRTDIDSARNRLQGLEQQGFLQKQTTGTKVTYLYNPKNVELRNEVERVRESYREHRFGVINLIIAKPNDLIQTFADAFRIKKGKKT